jgi:hypothetical protein
MPQSSVNIFTTVSAVPIMLPMLLVTRSLRLALLKTVISQVSTPQTVSPIPTLNRPSPSALLLLNHTLSAFLLPPIVKLSLVQRYFLAYLPPLRLLRLLPVRRRVPPPGPQGNLEPRLLRVLLRLPRPMRLPLPFLVCRLLVSSFLLFSYRKGQFDDEVLELDRVGDDVSASHTAISVFSYTWTIDAMIL